MKNRKKKGTKAGKQPTALAMSDDDLMGVVGGDSTNTDTSLAIGSARKKGVCPQCGSAVRATRSTSPPRAKCQVVGWGWYVCDACGWCRGGKIFSGSSCSHDLLRGG